MEATSQKEAEIQRRAVERFHTLLGEGDAAARSEAYLRERFAQANLLFGGRPLSPYLRPHFVTEPQFERIRQVCQTIWSCVQKVGQAADADEALLDVLGIGEIERRLVRIDPGYDYISPTARLDSFLTDTSYQFVELNAECPAGIAYAEVASQIFLDMPVMREFTTEFPVAPLYARRKMLDVLLDVWKMFRPTGGPPRIGIIDWEGLPTQAEFELFRDYFQAEGFHTTIADPRALTYENGRLRHGEFEIDVVYKRLLTNEFIERLDECQALLRAYEDRAACFVNSFRGKYVHKKMFFGVLTDERYSHLFNDHERAIIAEHVPWTRRVVESKTTFEGTTVDLVPFIRTNRDRLVLKPNDDYGGHGIYIGWESDEATWDAALGVALTGDYLVQDRVRTAREVFPALHDDGGYHFAEHLVDLDPLLFFGRVGGAFTRLSTSSLANVTSGAGMVPTFILKVNQ